jgi:hypothetical protein
MAKTMTGNIIGKHQVLSRRRYSIAFLYSHFHLLLLQKKLIKMETNCCLGFGNLSQQSKLMAGVIKRERSHFNQNEHCAFWTVGVVYLQIKKFRFD